MEQTMYIIQKFPPPPSHSHICNILGVYKFKKYICPSTEILYENLCLHNTSKKELFPKQLEKKRESVKIDTCMDSINSMTNQSTH